MLLGTVVLNGTFEKRDRVTAITIDARLEQGGDPLISCDREIVLVNANGKRVNTGGENGEGIYSFKRKLSTIAGTTITLPPEAGGYTLNAAQVALAMEMISDLIAADVKAPKPVIPDPTYTVMVDGGSGSGEYAQGATVNILAENAVDGMVFDKWVVVTGSIALGNEESAGTSFSMGAGAVEVTATYKALQVAANAVISNTLIVEEDSPGLQQVVYQLVLASQADDGAYIIVEEFANQYVM